MDYLISLLEGIITFISPCMLPMLPLYVSYFAGGDKGEFQGNAQQGLTRDRGSVQGSEPQASTRT